MIEPIRHLAQKKRFIEKLVTLFTFCFNCLKNNKLIGDWLVMSLP
ncbi:Uncharacterised protein [Serratia grimesii]|nr:Uncharacterised protein [Serratia grimesii]SMZ58147.1 Uncharacterised protein [Serratia grimesii]